MKLILLLCLLMPATLMAAKISIIIDDVGDNRRLALRTLDLDNRVAVSILPHTPFSKEVAQIAADTKRDVMLHQPMESKKNNYLLGPGPLMSDMDKNTVIETLKTNLDSMPESIGINNHMGSKLTQDPKVMSWVMTELINRGMFFIDSKTSSKSIGSDVAQDWHVPNMSRSVFLDHTDDLEAIDIQFKRLVQLAKRHGKAVAIGHPRKNTLEYLEHALLNLPDLNIELVSIRKLVYQTYQPNYPLSLNPGCFPTSKTGHNTKSIHQFLSEQRCGQHDAFIFPEP